MFLNFFKNRKTIAMILVVCMFFVLLMLKATDKKETTIQSPNIADPKNLTFPVLSGLSQEDKAVKMKLEIDKNNLSIPLDLPVYSIEEGPYLEREVYSFANRLGFTSQAMVNKDQTSGDVYVWYDEKIGYFQITPSLRVIDYKSSIQPTNEKQNFPNVPTITSLALQFLRSNNMLGQEDNLKFTKITYLKYGSEDFQPSEAKDAKTALVEFAQQIENYPLTNNAASTGSVNIEIDRSGKIISFYNDSVGKLTKLNRYPIKNAEKIEKTLNKAKILSLNSEEPRELINSISEIRIKQVQIAYLQEESIYQKTLQPIFILSGEAETTAKEIVPAFLHLEAIDRN